MNNAISVIVGVFALLNGVLGLFGKMLPFAGMSQYTKESLSKSARLISIPYLIAAAVFIYATYLNMTGHTSYTAFFISIAILVVVLILHIIVNKKVLRKVK